MSNYYYKENNKKAREKNGKEWKGKEDNEERNQT